MNNSKIQNYGKFFITWSFHLFFEALSHNRWNSSYWFCSQPALWPWYSLGYVSLWLTAIIWVHIFYVFWGRGGGMVSNIACYGWTIKNTFYLLTITKIILLLKLTIIWQHFIFPFSPWFINLENIALVKNTFSAVKRYGYLVHHSFLHQLDP